MSQSFMELLNKCPKAVLQAAMVSLGGEVQTELELLLNKELAWHKRQKAFARVERLGESWREASWGSEKLTEKRKMAWDLAHQSHVRYLAAVTEEAAYYKELGERSAQEKRALLFKLRTSGRK